MKKLFLVFLILLFIDVSITPSYGKTLARYCRNSSLSTDEARTLLETYGKEFNSQTFLEEWKKDRPDREILQTYLQADMMKKPNISGTLLKHAITRNDTSLLSLILNCEVDINKPLIQSHTPLFFALKTGSMKPARILKNKGAKLYPSTSGTNYLHNAIQNADTEILKYLIRSNVGINETDENGKTPLHLSVDNELNDVVELLLTNNADPNIKENSIEATPLYIAANNGLTNIVRMLLKHDANPDTPINNGATPLHIASHHGFKKIVRILIENNSKINVVERQTNETPLFTAVEQGYVEISRMLLETGANPNTANENGKTPLHVAIQRGHTKIASLLINTEADINLADNKGITPLHIAAHTRSVKITQKLIANDAEVNARAKDGKGPLHVATHKNSKEIVDILINHGAYVNIRSDRSQLTPLLLAVENGDTAIVRKLLNNGANVNVRESKNGAYPLHLSVINGYRDIVRLLLKHGARVNVEANRKNVYPLHLAAKKGHTNILKDLIKKGARINVTDSTGETPADYAVFNGHPDIEKVLERERNEAKTKES